MTAPCYIALYGGFLVVEAYDAPPGASITKCYTVSDCRSATPYPTFAAANAVAKWAANYLYPPDLRYFALLTMAHP